MVFSLKNAPFLDLKGCMFLLHVFHKSDGISMRNFKELTGKKTTSMWSGKLACSGLGYCWRFEGTEVLIMKLILCSWCYSARILVQDFCQIVFCRVVYLIVQNIKINSSLTLSIYPIGLWNNLFWSLFQVNEVLFLVVIDSSNKVTPTIKTYVKLHWVLLVFSIAIRWEVLEVLTKILIKEYSFQTLDFFACILQICLLKCKLK